MSKDRERDKFVRFFKRNKDAKLLLQLYPTLVALEDNRLMRGTVEFMAQCFFSATGDGTRECFGCCKRWTMARGPVAIMVVEPLMRKDRATVGMLAGLCPDCAHDRERIYAACKREFGTMPTEIQEAGNA